MKCFYLLPLALLTLLNSHSESLDAVASHALSSGKDATLNAFFAAELGLTSGNKSLPLKRLTIENADRTNVFNVRSTDKRTIIIFVKEKSLTTYYLTDTTGRLRKALVNDSSVKNGGLTNIPPGKAEAGFVAAKEIWLNKGAQGAPSKR